MADLKTEYLNREPSLRAAGASEAQMQDWARAAVVLDQQAEEEWDQYVKTRDSIFQGSERTALDYARAVKEAYPILRTPQGKKHFAAQEGSMLQAAKLHSHYADGFSASFGSEEQARREFKAKKQTFEAGLVPEMLWELSSFEKFSEHLEMGLTQDQRREDETEAEHLDRVAREWTVLGQGMRILSEDRLSRKSLQDVLGFHEGSPGEALLEKTLAKYPELKERFRGEEDVQAAARFLQLRNAFLQVGANLNEHAKQMAEAEGIPYTDAREALLGILDEHGWAAMNELKKSLPEGLVKKGGVSLPSFIKPPPGTTAEAAMKAIEPRHEDVFWLPPRPDLFEAPGMGNHLKKLASFALRTAANPFLGLFPGEEGTRVRSEIETTTPRLGPSETVAETVGKERERIEKVKPGLKERAGMVALSATGRLPPAAGIAAASPGFLGAVTDLPLSFVPLSTQSLLDEMVSLAAFGGRERVAQATGAPQLVGRLTQKIVGKAARPTTAKALGSTAEVGARVGLAAGTDTEIPIEDIPARVEAAAAGALLGGVVGGIGAARARGQKIARVKRIADAEAQRVSEEFALGQRGMESRFALRRQERIARAGAAGAEETAGRFQRRGQARQLAGAAEGVKKTKADLSVDENIASRIIEGSTTPALKFRGILAAGRLLREERISLGTYRRIVTELSPETARQTLDRFVRGGPEQPTLPKTGQRVEGVPVTEARFRGRQVAEGPGGRFMVRRTAGKETYEVLPGRREQVRAIDKVKTKRTVKGRRGEEPKEVVGERAVVKKVPVKPVAEGLTREEAILRARKLSQAEGEARITISSRPGGRKHIQGPKAEVRLIPDVEGTFRVLWRKRGPEQGWTTEFHAMPKAEAIERGKAIARAGVAERVGDRGGVVPKPEGVPSRKGVPFDPRLPERSRGGVVAPKPPPPKPVRPGKRAAPPPAPKPEARPSADVSGLSGKKLREEVRQGAKELEGGGGDRIRLSQLQKRMADVDVPAQMRRFADLKGDDLVAAVATLSKKTKDQLHGWLVDVDSNAIHRNKTKEGAIVEAIRLLQLGKLSELAGVRAEGLVKAAPPVKPKGPKPPEPPEAGPPAKPKGPAPKGGGGGAHAFKESERISAQTGEMVKTREEWRIRKATPEMYERIRDVTGGRRFVEPYVIEYRRIRNGEASPWEITDNRRTYQDAADQVLAAGGVTPVEAKFKKHHERDRKRAEQEAAERAKEAEEGREGERRKQGEDAFKRMRESKDPSYRAFAKRWNEVVEDLKSRLKKDPEFKKAFVTDKDLKRLHEEVIYADTVVSKRSAMKKFFEALDRFERVHPAPRGTLQGHELSGNLDSLARAAKGEKDVQTFIDAATHYTAKNPTGHEIGAVFDSSGKLVYRSQSRRAQEVILKRLNLARGGTIIHTHPDPSAFSKSDLGLALDYRPKNMVVISNGRAYSIKGWHKLPEGEGDLSRKIAAAGRHGWKRATAAVAKARDAGVEREAVSLDRALTAVSKEVVRASGGILKFEATTLGNVRKGKQYPIKLLMQQSQSLTGLFPVEKIASPGPPPTIPLIHSLINKAFKVSIFVQRQPRRSILGHLKIPTGETTVGQADNIPVMLHEAIHKWNIHRGFWKNLSREALADINRAEFSQTTFPGHTPRVRMLEQVAEAGRAYVTNPDYARTLAPRFVQEFEAEIARAKGAAEGWSEVTLAIRRMESTDPALRASVNTVYLDEAGVTPPDQLPVTRVDRALRYAQNEYQAVKVAERFFEKATGDQIRPSLSPWARLIDHLTFRSTTAEMAESGMRDRAGELIVDKVTGKVKNVEWLYGPVADLMKKGLKTEEEYWRAVDALLISGRGIFERRRTGKKVVTGTGGGFRTESQVEVEGFLAARGLKPSRFTGEELEGVREAARRYHSLMKDALDRIEESGILSREKVAELSSRSDWYANLSRLRTATPGDLLNAVSTRPLKKFEGSARATVSPYMSAYSAIAEMERVASYNVFVRHLAALAAPRRTKTGFVDFYRIGRLVEDTGEPGATSFLVNGKKRAIVFDPFIREMFDSLKTFDRELPWLRVGSIPARILRTTVTRMPEFAFRNFVRDLHDSLIKSSDTRVLPRDPLGAFRLGKEERAAYLARGGGQFGYYARSPRQWMRESQRRTRELRDQGNLVWHPVEGTRRQWRRWENLLAQSEIRPKLAEYRRSVDYATKKLGYGQLDAHYYGLMKSRALTDFQIVGSMMRIPAQLVPFLNASIQGVFSNAVALRARPGQTVARGLVSAGILVAVEEAASRRLGREEDLRNLPTWRRDLFINIPMGEGHWVVMPVGWFGGFFRAAVRRFWEHSITGDARVWEGMADSAIRSVVPYEAFKSTGGTQTLLPDVISASGPLVSTIGGIQYNRDFWGREIVPWWEKDEELALREGAERASRAAKAFSWALGKANLEFDPRYADFFIENQLGLAGRLGRELTDIGRPERQGPRVLGAIREAPATTPSMTSAEILLKRKGLYDKGTYEGYRNLKKRIFKETDPADRAALVRRADKLARKFLERVGAR